MRWKGLLFGISFFSAGCTSYVKEVTPQNFDALVLKPAKPVVVDFYANWCGPCERMEESYNEIAKDLQREVDFVRYDIEQGGDAIATYNIYAYPSVLIFAHGKLVCKFKGFRDEAKLRENIESCLEKVH